MPWGTMQSRNAPGDLPTYPGTYHNMPGTYSPAPVGGGFGSMMSGVGGWLGQSAFGGPDQGLLSQGSAPRMSRLGAIGELLTGAASGYMQGLNSGVRGSQWGMAALGGGNALKAAKEDEYQKQRQEVMDRIQYMNAVKKDGPKSRVVPPGAVVLGEDGKPIYSNPKSEKVDKPTGDLALVAALADPNTPPEQRKYLEGIYQDKIRGPAAPAAPQAPEIIRTAQYLFPKDPAAQRDWISSQKARPEVKPTGDIALVEALTNPNTSPEERTALQKILDKKTHITEPRQNEPPEIVQTAEHLFPGDPEGQRKWIMDQKTVAPAKSPEIIQTAERLFPGDPEGQRKWIMEQKAKTPAKPAGDIAIAEALSNPNTPPEERAALQKLWDKKTHITEPRQNESPEVIQTAEHLFPGDPEAQRKWIIEQKTKAPAKPAGDIALANALNDPNTPMEVRTTLQQILDHKLHPNQDKSPALPADPEIVKTAKFMFPGDAPAQRAWVEDQKDKSKAPKYLKMDDGSYVPVPAEPQNVPARPKPSELSAEELKLKSGAEEALIAGEGTVDILGRLQELNPQVPGGPLTGVTKYGTMLSNPEQYNRTQELSTLATQQALGQLRSTFGAQPTEGERQILLDVSGSVDQPPEVRKKIYDRAMQAVKSRQEMTRKRLKELNEGSYGKATPEAAKIRTFNPATGRLE